MADFPLSPRVLKGALVGLDVMNPIASVVVFQYNPETVTRTLQPSAAGEGGARVEAMRLRGAPTETIKMEVEIDATDKMEEGDGLTGTLGIHPQLAALEMMLYPKSVQVIANTVALALGTMEVLPPVAPLTLLVWGLKRVLPVRLQEFTITEEAYDPSLNPIRARVSLGLRVLSYNDLSLANPGYSLFVVHQIAKEAMAVIGSVGNLGQVASGNVKIF